MLNLGRGARGEDVRLLQVALNAAWARPLLVEDGVFGHLTENAVRESRAAVGLPEMGISDAALLEKLSAMSWGAAVLSFAREDLVAEIREERPNDGADLRRLYFEPAEVLPPANWCSLAAWSWMRRAAKLLQRPLPIPGSAVARVMISQFKEAERRGKGRWIPAAILTDLNIVPGVIPIWDRSVRGRPETAWWGHTGVASRRCRRSFFHSIEANSGPHGDRVAEMERSRTDPRLLGVGVFL